jgi:hypothetical protein
VDKRLSARLEFSVMSEDAPTPQPPAISEEMRAYLREIGRRGGAQPFEEESPGGTAQCTEGRAGYGGFVDEEHAEEHEEMEAISGPNLRSPARLRQPPTLCSHCTHQAIL